MVANNDLIIFRMRNKEFFKTSEIEVESLNGSTSEQAQEAWRAGYLFAQSIIKKSFETEYQNDFLETVENFVNDELEVFSFNSSDNCSL